MFIVDFQLHMYSRGVFELIYTEMMNKSYTTTGSLKVSTGYTNCSEL